MLWLGGWWLFTLLAVASCVAVHEFVTTARPLRPLAPAVYAGALLALFGAEKGGVVWLLGGFLATFVLAFVLHAVSSTRAPTTAAVGSTILGSAWIGLGLGFLLLLREMHDHGRLIAFTVVLAAWAAATFAYFGGRLARPSQARAAPLAGQVVGRAAGRSRRGHLRGLHRALRHARQVPVSVWQAIVLGIVIVVAELIGDLFESALKRDLEVKDTGRLLGGHGGMLDRIDGLLFAAPAAYFLVIAYGFH